MSMLIAAFMFIILLTVALAGLLWSIGIIWPIREKKLLAQTVIGTAGIETMPSRLKSLALSIFALVAGVLALSLADHDSGGLPLTLLGLPFAAIFFARGIIGYTSSWIARTPEPSFRFNDRRVYSPLSLFLGAGFIALVIMRLL